MNSIDLEYAVKTDVRNNPIQREADGRHGRDLRQLLLLAMLIVAMLLFSVRQHSTMDLTGYRIEQLRSDRADEQSKNRQLRLNLEALRAPQQIEPRAAALGLRRPALADTVVIERARAASPSGAIVARAR
jgi:hypothetical protein